MKQEGTMTKVSLEVDTRWLKLLGELSRHQEGFVWVSIDYGHKENNE
jgi:SAM-dependent MidA family methyltransferase